MLQTDANYVHFDLTPDVRRPTGTNELSAAYAPRTRYKLHARFGAGWPGAGRIGVNAPSSVRTGLVAAGATCDDQGRVSVERKTIVGDDWQSYAPLVARRRFMPIHVDMIPTTSFGASLSNLLQPEAWREIRRHSHRAAGYVCEICGEVDGPIECHEVWTFNDGRSVAGRGIQRLSRLLSLCRSCHELFHPGLAGLRGRSKQVAARMCAVNDWSSQELETVMRKAFAIHSTRSRRAWTLDLTTIAHLGPLIVSDRWEPVGGGRDLAILTPSGRSVTRLLGASYVHRGRMFQAG